MSAIEFVVRNSAGALSRGFVGGDDGVTTVAASAGADISLNLTQGQIVGYKQVGANLEITLIDGRVIVVQDYFGADNAPASDLFISADGLLAEVQLAPGMGGTYYGNYVQQDVFGKWSPDDDLYFIAGQDTALVDAFVQPADDSVGMLGMGFPLLGGLAAIPLVLLGLAGGDDDKTVLPDDTDRENPVGEILEGTKDTGHVVNEEDRADGVDISGTGTPGATIVVTINNHTQTTIITDGGTWTVTFPPRQIDEGTYETDITVTVTKDDRTITIEDVLVVDTEIWLTFDEDNVGGDGTVNAVERDGVVTLTGTVEAGSTVTVVMNSITYTTVVTGTTWLCTLPAGELTTGEFTQSVIVNATDGVGNSTSITGNFTVDTVIAVTIDTATFETDGTVNFVERSDGMTLTGTAQAGASVVVTMAGVSQTVIATAGGSWSAIFGATTVPLGEGSAGVSAVATDGAGNVATATGTIIIDTLVNRLEIINHAGGADRIINGEENGQTITITGMVEVGSTVSVVLAGVTRVATVSANGSWTVSYAAGSITGGEYASQLVVNATDRAGNTRSVSEEVRVDTVVGDVTLSPLPIEIDDIVNFVERSDGVMIHGTATPGLTVTVKLGNATHQVVAQADGTWSSLFVAGEIPAGTYNAPISASITDSAGNGKTVTDTVRIDTEVNPFTLATPVEGDNMINAAEKGDGVILSGTVEAGSTVVVSFAGQSRTVTAGADGAWSVSVAGNAFANGTYATSVVATATDLAGNVSTITHAVNVDTVVVPLSMKHPVEGDDLVSRSEAADGITLTGIVEVGSTVSVTFEGTTRAATVAANGIWSVNFTAAEIPAGEYDADVSISAVDRVGNTKTITETFEVDTTPPDAPMIEAYTRGSSGVRGFTIDMTADDIDLHQVNGSGGVNTITHTTTPDPVFNELNFSFNQTIPNGSHIVMTASDDSGNATSTMFVLEETLTNVVNVTNAGYDRFNIEAIDLQFAEDSVLTLTAADLESLAAHSNQLTIHGGLDDTVNIVGATATGNHQTIDGRTYDIYSLGTNGGTLIIDDAITVNT